MIGEWRMIFISHTVHGPYPVHVDYSQPLWQMVANGDYREADPRIAKWFKLGQEPSSVELYAVEFVSATHGCERMNVLHDLNELGFRPAAIAELLAFGASSHIPLHGPSGHDYVALGSYGWGVMSRPHIAQIYVPYAGGAKYLRATADDSWSSGRFLAVRK
jgi:hypothetical protein